MKAKAVKAKRMNFSGNGACAPAQEGLTATRKQWRQKLGYCSIFAAVPAVLASHVQAIQSEEANKPEARVAGNGVRFLERLNLSRGNRALLKRQSMFRLPHQKDNFAMLAPFAGNDDCPGRAIPEGNYTAAAPYVDSGDTTGANDTVTYVTYYYGYDANGPDHIYTFTLTGHGPNPRIEVSTTSGTYKPLVYILQGSSASACPAGTGNVGNNGLFVYDTRWSGGNSVMVDSGAVDFLPLNVPLYLFVDSRSNDGAGSGPYTIRMQDVTVAGVASSNQIDNTQFFVQQNYRDFLNREPDPAGQAFWTSEIASCGGDQQCIDAKRVDVSAAYFLSIEFQQTGYLVYRFYKAAYGNLPGAPVPLRFDEFLPDTKEIGQGVVVNQSGWDQVLENNKQAFATEFVQRARFVSNYPTSMSSEQFVDALFLNAGVTPSATDRAAAVNEFSFSATTADVAARARALRRVAESSTLAQQEFNRAFVLMQYFGYLRRNPNDPPEPTRDFQGYNFWLAKLDQFDGNYNNAEMVRVFLISAEYRQRFGS